MKQVKKWVMVDVSNSKERFGEYGLKSSEPQKGNNDKRPKDKPGNEHIGVIEKDEQENECASVFHVIEAKRC